MNWPIVSLGEICSFEYGKSLPASTRKEGDVAVFGSNGSVGSHAVPLTSGQTVIIGRKGSIGEVNFSENSCWPIDTTYFVDANLTDQDIKWLYYALQHSSLQHLNRATGVPGLSRNDAYEVKLLLPPLSEQKRIATILDQADALRRLCRRVLDRLNTLGQAIFHEMFGNRKCFPTALLHEIAEVSSGITKGRQLRGAPTRSVPYMAVSNVQDQHLVLDVVKTIDATDDEIERYRLRKNDLLLTEGGDPDKLGRGTLWNEELPECIHQNHIFRVRLASEAIRPAYLKWFVGSLAAKQYFLRSAKQTTGIASINKTQLGGLPIDMPQIKRQIQFEERLNSLEASIDFSRHALAKAEALFTSLQHRAFRGEL